MSEVNKADMESQGLYLSIFISHTSTTRDKKKKKKKKKKKQVGRLYIVQFEYGMR